MTIIDEVLYIYIKKKHLSGIKLIIITVTGKILKYLANAMRNPGKIIQRATLAGFVLYTIQV